MKITCPTCGSTQFKSYEIIHAEGTQSITTEKRSSTSYGVTSRTEGTTQTALAARCAPPAKLPYVGPIIAIFLFFALVYLIPVVGPYLSMLCTPALILYVVWAVKTNIRNHPEQMRAWRSTCLCLGCGTSFSIAPNK